MRKREALSLSLTSLKLSTYSCADTMDREVGGGGGFALAHREREREREKGERDREAASKGRGEVPEGVV